MKTIIIALTIFLLCFVNLFPQTGIDGKWKGAIEIMDTELIIIVNFMTKDHKLHATIDIPQQGAVNLPLTNVRHGNGSVYFELPAPPGLAIFDGTRDTERITGNFTQAGITGTFYLDRSGEEEETVENNKNLYREENIIIHNEDIRLGCTLTLPSNNGLHPAIVLITGSGAQDRDETIFGFKPFRILADHLTPNGIAVLRCDDRGVGESTGSVGASTSLDLAGDVAVMVGYLRGRDDIRDELIGLCGHSEGGIIAPMIAGDDPDIAFVISMAGTAVPGRDILIAQTELIFESAGMGETITRKQMELINRVYDAAVTGEGWDHIETLVRELAAMQLEQMTDVQRDAIVDIGQYIENQVKIGMAGLKSNWYRFFIVHDPSDDWRRVTQPVLGLFGELDLQVPPEMNKNAMKRALDSAGNTDYTLKIIPQANHLFQKATTGSPAEYVYLEKEFIDGFLDIILEWVTEKVEYAL
jgi:uncharacterized protein